MCWLSEMWGLRGCAGSGRVLARGMWWLRRSGGSVRCSGSVRCGGSMRCGGSVG
jgi:hypothetical protein